MQVRLGEGKDLIDAKVIGSDSSTDLAVIKVDPKDVKGGLHPVTLGESKALRVGEPTIAIGPWRTSAALNGSAWIAQVSFSFSAASCAAAKP